MTTEAAFVLGFLFAGLVSSLLAWTCKYYCLEWFGNQCHERMVEVFGHMPPHIQICLLTELSQHHMNQQKQTGDIPKPEVRT